MAQHIGAPPGVVRRVVCRGGAIDLSNVVFRYGVHHNSGYQSVSVVEDLISSEGEQSWVLYTTQGLAH